MADIDVSEIEVLAKDLTQVPMVVGKQVSQVVRKAMQDVQANAQHFAPVDTGFLRANITARQINQYAGTVTSGANYAIFQEYGTSRQPGTPHMRPAADKVEPEFQAALEQVIGDMAL